MAEPKIPYNKYFKNELEGLGIAQQEQLCLLKNNIRRQLRILDEQNAIGRYKWINLPDGVTGELLERMLYYRGQVALFFMPSNGKFYVLPYVLDGNLDCYGRYTGIVPLPFLGTKDTTKDGKVKPWIDGLKKQPVYGIPLNITDKEFLDGAVIIKDYTPQENEYITPRQILQEPILDTMAEAFPLARTSLISNSGVKGMRVSDQDQAQQVKLASRAITKAALTGDPWIPVVGSIDFQNLTDGTALKSEEFLIYMQALDNYRLSLLGLKNGGLFQKKAHMLEAEQEMNNGVSSSALNDGLKLRQQACDIINSIWGLGVWCELSETVIGDKNGNGFVDDSKEPEVVENNEIIESEGEDNE